MPFHFTKHAKEKFLRIKKSGFTISKKQVEQTVLHPLKIDKRHDGTYIAMILLDTMHVLRVVHRTQIIQVGEKPMKYSYESEADILSIKLTNTPYDYAEEVGDFIVHYDKKDNPVYIEILNASKFLTKATTILPKSSRKQILRHL